MPILYDLIFLFCALFYLPIYLYKKKFHPGFSLRWGKIPAEQKFNRPIWIHAVSVGEAMSAKILLDGLKKIYPGKNFVISTVTPTGNKIAFSLAGPGDFVTFLPLDFSFIVRKVLARIDPALFIIVETEIWPNLIFSLHERRVPIAIVNGRISDRSFQGYSAVRLLLKPVLNQVDLFCAQSERDAERLLKLGADPERVRVSGNLKFDLQPGEKMANPELNAALGLRPEDKFLVAGSTHPGEEAVILEIYRGLLPEFPALRLLLAPRHPERCLEIVDLITQSGFTPQSISSLNFAPPGDARVIFILDTVGKLLEYYAIADIVFVGGSLVEKGGHNILEPASLGKPVIFGPQMFNFHDIAELFLQSAAGLQVHDADGLKQAIRSLLVFPEKRRELGMRGLNLIRENQGAVRKTLDCLKEKFDAKRI